jgi:hypothetical protein
MGRRSGAGTLLRGLAVASAVVGLGACDGASPVDGGGGMAGLEGRGQAATDAGVVSPVVSFDASAGEYPEGIAVGRDGGVYVGLTGLGRVVRIGEGGGVDLVATIPLEPGDLGVLGLTFDVRGYLYAAVVSSSPAVHGVWRIGPDGWAARLGGTEVMGFPNDLTFDRRGHLYVTDSAMGAVWRVGAAGGAELWVQDPLLEGTGDFGLGIPIGANGIVFLPGGSGGRGGGGGEAGRLLVANTEKGQLVEIAVLARGSAGVPGLVAAGPGLVGLDGLAADEHGRVFGAVNVQDRVVRIDPDGGVEEVVGEGLDFPAGVALGTRSGGRHTLFVVNFALINDMDPSPGVVAVALGPPGRR